MKLKIKRALLTASAASLLLLCWSAAFAEVPAPGTVKLPTALEGAIEQSHEALRRILNGDPSGYAALFADRDRLSTLGIETSWLACAIGNERAAKFYEKNGWRRVGNMINPLPTSDGIFQLEVWRYEKSLRRDIKSCGERSSHRP